MRLQSTPFRLMGLLPLGVAAVLSVAAFGAIPQDGSLHPLALLASLLPLQLAALYWATAAAPSPGSGTRSPDGG